MMFSWMHATLPETLGWTLLHSLWQLSAIAAAFALLLPLQRRATANVRYLTACAGLALMALLPIATFVWLLPPPAEPAHHLAIAQPIAPAPAHISPPQTPLVFTQQTLATSPRHLPEIVAQWTRRLLPYATAVYLAGLLFMFARLLAGHARLRRLIRTASLPPTHVQQLLTAALTRMGMTSTRRIATIRLLQSPAVEAPTLLGILRPAILLPLAAITGLTPGQLSALLAHELAHLRRYDHFANLLQCLLETLLFYHPAMWWLSAHIREEREHCCDDQAAEIAGDRVAYAHALASMESLRTTPPAFPSLLLAANGGSLLHRIRRLLGLPSPRRPWLPIAAILLLLFAALAAYLLATSAHAPSPPGPSQDSNTGRGSGRKITMEVKLLVVPTPLLDSLKPNWNATLSAQLRNGDDPASTPLRSATLKASTDATSIAHLLEAIRGQDTVRIFAPPLANLTQGQLTRLTAGDRMDYIKAVKSAPGSTTPVPQIEALQTGLIFDMVAVDAADHQLAADLHATYVSLDGMDTFSTSTRPDGAPEAMVQVPRISTAEFTARAPLAEGRTLLIAGPTMTGERELETRTPILSALPGMGKLFTNRSFIKEEITLLYVLQPIAPQELAVNIPFAGQALPPINAHTMVSIPEGGTLLIGDRNSSKVTELSPSNFLSNIPGLNRLVPVSPILTDQPVPPAPVPAPANVTATPNESKPQIFAKFIVAVVDESALPENSWALKENESETVPLEKKPTEILQDFLAHGKIEVLSRPSMLLNDKEEGTIFTGQEGRTFSGQVMILPTGYHQKDPTNPASEWIPDGEALTRGLKLGITASVLPKPEMRLKLDLHMTRIIKVERSPAPNVPPEKHLEVFKPIFEDKGMTTSLTTESGKSVMIVGPLYTGEPDVTPAPAAPAKIAPKRQRLIILLTTLQPPAPAKL